MKGNIVFLDSGMTVGHPLFERNNHRASTRETTYNAERDPSLDFVKGLLVLGMIAYHAGVSFIPDTRVRSILLDGLLNFVSGSWVFICGLIITTHYHSRFQTEARDVSIRLWVRAVKLILLFSVLNLLVILLGVRPSSELLNHTTLAKVFIHGDGKLSSFGILLGIGYVLLLGPLFLAFRMTGVAVSIMAIVTEEYLVQTGHVIPGNYWIVLCGLAGMTIGATIWPSFVKVICVIPHKRWMLILMALSAVGAYYAVSIGWSVNRGHLPVYLWGVAGVLAALYLSHGWFVSMPTINGWLRLVGRYSLISYLFQMALFRLALSAQSFLAVALPYWWMFVIVVLMVSVMISLLDREIRKNVIFQKSYQLVFG